MGLVAIAMSARVATVVAIWEMLRRRKAARLASLLLNFAVASAVVVARLLHRELILMILLKGHQTHMITAYRLDGSVSAVDW